MAPGHQTITTNTWEVPAVYFPFLVRIGKRPSLRAEDHIPLAGVAIHAQVDVFIAREEEQAVFLAGRDQEGRRQEEG